MAPRTKSRPIPYDKKLLGKAIANPGDYMDEVDPRDLHSYQPSIHRAGVSYYMGDKYHQTGETYADQHHEGNKVPFIYTRTDGKRIILSGHHRAATALLKGEPLRCAHVVEGEEDGKPVRHAEPLSRGASSAPVSDCEGEDSPGGGGGNPQRWYRRFASRILPGGDPGPGDAGRQPRDHPSGSEPEVTQ